MTAAIIALAVTSLVAITVAALAIRRVLSVAPRIQAAADLVAEMIAIKRNAEYERDQARLDAAKLRGVADHAAARVVALESEVADLRSAIGRQAVEAIREAPSDEAAVGIVGELLATKPRGLS